MVARSCEDRAPELFAAFMTTADAAVDGGLGLLRALRGAPSRRAGTSHRPRDASQRRIHVRQMPWHREGTILADYPGDWDQAAIGGSRVR
jgi:hypothetical protein